MNSIEGRFRFNAEPPRYIVFLDDVEGEGDSYIDIGAWLITTVMDAHVVRPRIRITVEIINEASEP
jgi:hypothetical protein